MRLAAGLRRRVIGGFYELLVAGLVARLLCLRILHTLAEVGSCLAALPTLLLYAKGFAYLLCGVLVNGLFVHTRYRWGIVPLICIIPLSLCFGKGVACRDRRDSTKPMHGIWADQPQESTPSTCL